MGTHPIFESDFDCLTEIMLVARLARSNCKNFLASTSGMVNRLDQQRHLSSGSSSLLSRGKTNHYLFQHDQRRELVFEFGMGAALLGLYYLLIERTSDLTQKPAYYMPYECGFNMIGGVVFFGFSTLMWVFLIFELEIIMLMLQPTHDISMPLFISCLFCSWCYLYLFPAVNNL